MKNKTTKTIACVIAGLTLSACGASEDDIPPYTGLDTSHIPDDLQDDIFYVSSSNAYRADCSVGSLGRGSNSCFAGVEPLGRLKPLTDNSGTAIYSGSIDAQRSVSGGQYQTYNGSINLRVNFSDRTFRENTTIHAGITSHSLNIRGGFLPNGSINGTATISGSRAYLFGRIGADELTAACIGNGVACGFTTYRE